jgi:DNA-3-methyladenine glycosylase
MAFPTKDAVPPTWKPIQRWRIPPDAADFARWLIGKIVVRRIGRVTLAGRIVETEAYTSDDAASHSYKGQTPRNRSMFLPAGHAYIYFIYGRSFMLNVSSGKSNVGDAVLIRALEPLMGLAALRRHRPGSTDRDLMRGPGRLAQALHIDRSLDGIDLCAPGPLWLADDGYKPGVITVGPRVGIRHNMEALRRFFLADDPHVSRRR